MSLASGLHDPSPSPLPAALRMTMMEQPKYSIDEIDEMRASLWAIETTSRYPSGHNPTETKLVVEAKLRTYMQNGTTPAELRLAAAEWQAKCFPHRA